MSQTWNAWGKSWGRSWGVSWGPFVSMPMDYRRTLRVFVVTN